MAREVMAAVAAIFGSKKYSALGKYTFLAVANDGGIYTTLESGIFDNRDDAERYFESSDKNAAQFFEMYAREQLKRVPPAGLEVDIFLAKNDEGFYSICMQSHYDYSFYKEEVVEYYKDFFDYEKLCFVASSHAGDVIPSRVAEVIPGNVCKILQDSITDEAAARVAASFDYADEEDNILLDAVNDFLSPNFGMFHVSSYYRNMTLHEFVAARITDALDIQRRVIVRKVFGYDASELA